jgi:hypothetical protein
MTNDCEKFNGFITKQNYDAVVVGSDTVWEARISAIAPKPPNPYFLVGVKGPKKVAFAASADPLRTDFVNSLKKLPSVITALRDFEFISVRDSATSKFLITLGLEESRIWHLPDPTLLWDFSNLIIPTRPLYSDRKPIAGIAVPSNILNSMVNQLELAGYAILDFSGKHSRSIAKPGSWKLGQRLSLYRKIDLMVTDRFHGSIFAMKIGGVPTAFIEDPRKWPNSNSKGRDLYEKLGVRENVLRIGDDNAFSSWLAKLKPNDDMKRSLLNERFKLIENKHQHVIDVLIECLSDP